MDKKSIIAISLCVLLLIGWFPLMQRLGWTGPAPKAQPGAVTATGTVPEPGQPVKPVPAAAPSAKPPPAPAAAVAGAPGEAAPPPASVPLVSPGEFSADVDPQTGGLRQITLSRYIEDDRETPVRLGQAAAALGAVVPPADMPLGPARVLTGESDGVTLERTLGDAGLVLRTEWRAAADKPYKLDYRLTVRNQGTAPAKVARLGICVGSMGLPIAQASSGFASPVDLASDLAPQGADHSKSYAAKKITKLSAEENARLAATRLRWAVVHSKYFVQYLAAGDSGFHGAELAAPLSADGQEQRVSATVFLPGVELEPGAEHTFRLAAYAGPKEYRRLHELGGRLDSILQMDLFFFWHPEWMGAVARVILKGLIWTHASIGRSWAYGLAIVAITFLVKLLFWPLTHYSTLSMKKMQTVQPRIVEIREKYKDDPAKVQQKIMELYREEKVNPLGGCLPVVLQIPVFFALFNVFRGAIELRHASFLWVTDLSQPDTLPWLLLGLPIRPLAILMSVTMFLQQKLTPSSLDPMQARMMMIMTVFFAFIFYGMPAGLTLYWTVNQVLSIVQTLITYRLVKQMTPARPNPA